MAKTPTPPDAEDMRLRYDAVFHRACLECSDALAGDREIHRLAEEVLSAPDLDAREAAYLRLDDNVDRKLRGLLSAREKDERFHIRSIQIGSHVCRTRRRILITATCRGKVRRWSRQSIEVSLKGSK
jgi:hypothetical protein